MVVSTSYRVEDSILVKGSQDFWKITAVHISLFSKTASVVYDIQKEDGRRMMIQESSIVRLIE